MKTNKSFAKRLKVTRTGKIMARKAGHNHFNAKASRSKQLGRKGEQAITIKNKTASNVLSNLK